MEAIAKNNKAAQGLNIVAMVPARMGSTRLKMKNLALLNGRPLIYYAIQAAKDSDIFKKIVLNSEDKVFGVIAERYGVEFYQRPYELGSSTAKSDSVVYDFMMKYPADITVWVNPTSPLQSGAEVKRVIEYFIENELDSLITVKNEQVHCIYKGRPVNYDEEGLFAQTQDLEPVQPFVYSVMMWRNKVFIKEFEERGYALFCGKTGYYPVSKLSAIIIKRKEDLMMADYLLRGIASEEEYEIVYDEIVK